MSPRGGPSDEFKVGTGGGGGGGWGGLYGYSVTRLRGPWMSSR